MTYAAIAGSRSSAPRVAFAYACRAHPRRKCTRVQPCDRSRPSQRRETLVERQWSLPLSRLPGDVIGFGPLFFAWFFCLPIEMARSAVDAPLTMSRVCCSRSGVSAAINLRRPVIFDSCSNRASSVLLPSSTPPQMMSRKSVVQSLDFRSSPQFGCRYVVKNTM